MSEPVSLLIRVGALVKPLVDNYGAYTDDTTEVMLAKTTAAIMQAVEEDRAALTAELSQTRIGLDVQERALVQAKAREAALVTALVKAGIPLEVLAAQIAEKPYGELTADLQNLITATVVDIRAALAAAPVSGEAKP